MMIESFLPPIVELGNPQGAFLFNLSTFRSGASTVLDRISSNQKGIYAWFRSFDLPSDSKDLEDYLIKAIESEKFYPRSGFISPYFDIKISSKNFFSENKRKILSEHLKKDSFRSQLVHALKWSILLQGPLYIGKSKDIRKRIASHLEPESNLRLRLNEAGIEIDNCQLLIFTINNSDNGEENEINDNEGQEESLFEEIFSRLFNPSFTIRLG